MSQCFHYFKTKETGKQIYAVSKADGKKPFRGQLVKQHNSQTGEIEKVLHIGKVYSTTPVLPKSSWVCICHVRNNTLDFKGSQIRLGQLKHLEF